MKEARIRYRMGTVYDHRAFSLCRRVHGGAGRKSGDAGNGTTVLSGKPKG
jgi:hypothetical protein